MTVANYTFLLGGFTLSMVLVPAACSAGSSVQVTNSVPVTMSSYGPVHVGMTIKEAAKSLGIPMPQVPRSAAMVGCYIVDMDHANFMLEYGNSTEMPGDGEVVRIGTMNPLAVTARGLRIGSPISQVKNAFGHRLSNYVQFYSEDANYRTLVAVSANGETAIRFDTGPGGIQWIYVGFKETIQLVEGCA